MTNARPIDGRPCFQRQARIGRQASGPAFSVCAAASGSAKGVQDVHAGLRKQTVRVTNRPARFPPSGAWPFELRADMVAALLDFDTTRQLCKAIADGTAPRPGAVRGRGARLEVVWSREAVRAFVVARHRGMQADLNEDGLETA
ncbi:hypothetical protein ACFFWD_33670 [Bradyrhizobium erythrophlei]|uniref:hypothetical protein n=1 Tax=Bradyrhizobium erythrophlei TaxID=1437360 RepID=UPI0035EB0D04